MGHQSVTTFDGLSYNSSIGTCDQVIAKDCSGRYKFAVLARHDNYKKVSAGLFRSVPFSQTNEHAWDRGHGRWSPCCWTRRRSKCTPTP